MSMSLMLSSRDRALLRAVSIGRCEFRGGCQPVLLVDGLACADWAASRRLVEAGLVVAPDASIALAAVSLTAAGSAALAG